MGKGKRIKVDADEAIEFTQAELITLLQSTDKKLQTLLSTNDIRFDERLKVVLGFVDRSDPLQIRTLFNEDNKIPIQDELIAADLHALKRECTNGAVNAGNHVIKIEPAADSILMLYYVAQVNNDAAARDVLAYIETAGAVTVGRLYKQVALGAGVIICFPNESSTAYTVVDPKGAPLILTDAFELRLQLDAVAVNEDSSFFMLYSFVGTAPTITETGPAGAVWSDVA